MPRPKKQIQSKKSSFSFPIEIIFLPLIFLKIVGDIVRYLLLKLFSFLFQTYKNIYALFHTSYTQLSSFFVKIKKPMRAMFHKKKREKSIVVKKTTKSISIYERSSHIKNPPVILEFIKRFRLRYKPSPLPSIKHRSIHTKRIPYKLPSLWMFLAGVGVTILVFIIPYTLFTWIRTLPNPKILSHREIEVTTKIFDRNDILLYEIYADQNRTPRSLSDIPEYVKYATIAIEDRDFYKHNGFSLRGIARAAKETLIHKRLQGGSTITQQLIKSTLLSPEIKLTRKIKEIILAFWTERIYTKDQILEMYLNQVPYGGTSWGIEAASQTYFGKSVTQLTLAEATLLAGLPAAPSEYSPFGNHPQKAFIRQQEVLRRMVEDGYITEAQAQQTLSDEIHITTPKTTIRAPHFVMHIKELLEEKYGSRLVERGGLRIKTSIDSSIQQMAQTVVKDEVEALKPLRVGNGAAVITNPKTGEILAMIGSKDYFNLEDEGNVNITTSLRQPGSSIKVVTYTAALENGMTAATLLSDTPVVYNNPGSPPYAPVNYDGTFHGLVPIRYALGNSYNIPAVRTLERIGLKNMIEKARAMGITTWEAENRYGLSLTLGGGEVTMLEMATVYGTLANMGKRMDLLPILEISDYTGRVLEKNKPKGRQVVRSEVSWIMTNILSDNAARTAAFGPNSKLVIPNRTVAVKTGTTNEKRDNWAIGYTPSYVVTTWVGNNDNTPMDPKLTSGITGATPIWHAIMSELLKDKPDDVLPKPDSVINISCYFGREEYFVKGTEPKDSRCGTIPTPTTSPSP